MSYPSVIGTLSNPNATDRLSSPSHSSLHQSENTEIIAIETFVGTLSSVQGSLVYDIRSTNSNGGGHVQTANTGGTGQTFFNKGDLLVAQSSSVLAKLAVGTDTQVLQASSSAISGVNWATNISPKLAINASVFTLGSANETSIISVTVPGSTFGINNALRVTMFVNLLGTTNDRTVTFRGIYGTSSVGTIAVASINGFNTTGTIQMEVLANNSASNQVGFLTTDLYRGTIPYSPTSSFLGMKTYVTSAITEDSSVPKVIGITAQTNNISGTTFNVGGYIVERIT